MKRSVGRRAGLVGIIAIAASIGANVPQAGHAATEPRRPKSVPTRSADWSMRFNAIASGQVPCDGRSPSELTPVDIVRCVAASSAASETADTAAARNTTAMPRETQTGRTSAAGYRLVATDGGIFTYGDASFYGSTGSLRLNKPIVGMARTPSGNGYWLVASDGGIFTFGDARFFGSTGSIALNWPISSMAPTPSGNGYWLLAVDGGIFTFGDATYRGSIPADYPTLNAPGNLTVAFVAILPSTTGNGYNLVDWFGFVESYGDAVYRGDLFNQPLNSPILGAVSTPSGLGYWLCSYDGGVFTFGDAPFKGSAGNIRLNNPVVGISSVG